ncbi:hypothetical protein CHUAL_004588 [Chamberlinius hualienensis]
MTIYSNRGTLSGGFQGVNTSHKSQHYAVNATSNKNRILNSEDLLTRTSWVDAKVAYNQVHKGKASGNKAALWLRIKLQTYLFIAGCFIQRHAGKVLFVGLLVLSTFCVGLKSATLETDVEKLWVEKGGRLEKELDYVQKTLGEGSGSTNQIILQVPKQESANILRQEALLAHLEVVLVASQVKVEMFDITWELKDVCNCPSSPTFDVHHVDQIFEKLFPCVTITPLDCFWEGSRIVGPEFPVIIPGLTGGVRWTSLNPLKMLQTMKNNFLNLVFPFDTVEDFMKRSGIASGYQEKPCLNPSDPDCPITAPNKKSGQIPDIGTELTGGCYGFATKYMHWPEDLVVGGSKKNKTGHIVKAEALQTVMQLMGEREMYEYWKDNYVVHNIDWTVEKAKSILELWQMKFTEEVLNFARTSNVTKNFSFSAFSTASLAEILRDFSEVSSTRIALGYVLMLIYACISLLRWSDPVHSQSGVGIAGVLLVAVSVAAGLGLCAILGIAFNASTTQIVPFLALGLGVDDMFLLAHTYAGNWTSDVRFEDLTGECLKRTGVSVLLTSISNVGAFFAAAIIPVPALRSFALQAAILVLFNVASMLIVFPAVMSLDIKRRRAKRIDIFCCFPCSNEDSTLSPREVDGGKSSNLSSSHNIPLQDVPSKRRTITTTHHSLHHPVTVLAPTLTPSVESLATVASTRDLIRANGGERTRACMESQQECYTWTLTWFARDHYGPFLQKAPVKVLAVAIFFALLAAGVWGVMRVTDGLDLTDIVPRNTNEYNFLAAQNKYFGFYHMFSVTKGNFEYPTNQRILYEYHNAFTRVHEIIKDDNGGLPEFWLSLFRDWLLALQKAFDKDWRDGNINQERWFPNASDEGILAYKLLVQTGYVDNPIDKTLITQHRLVDSEGIIHPKAFYNYLSAWVTNDALAYSASQANLRPEPRQWFHDRHDVELKIPKSQPLVFAQIPFYLNNLGETEEITRVIEEIRDICHKFEEKGLPNFPLGIPFTFWEQYLGLRFYLTLALGSVLAATFLVVSVLLLNPWAATVMVVFLATMVIELFGFMGFMGIRLSAVPAVILIITVGIGMEFVGHIGLAFLTSLGSRDRRMGMALEHMFAPVVHGAISTLLGVAMLAFSQFDFIVRYFFCVLFAMIVIGLVNGLLLLPVILSLVGPLSEVIPKDDPNRLSPPTPEPSPKPLPKIKQFKTAFSKRIHPRTHSENSLSTITEEPPSWQSSHEIVVQPELVVETTTYPTPPSQQDNQHNHSSTSSSSSSTSSSSDDGSTHSSSKWVSNAHQGGITTKVTATTKVKVEVHTPRHGAIDREPTVRHKRRKDGIVKVEIDPDSDSSGK